MKQIKNFEEIISAISFAIMVCVVSINVISRIFFKNSFGFTEEVATIGFIYSVFFGTAALYKNHGLIAIDVIVEMIPIKAKNIVTYFNFLILLVVNVTFFYLSTKLTIDGWSRLTPFLRLPYTFVYLAAPSAFLLMSVYSMLFLIKSITNRTKSVLLNDDINQNSV